MPRDAIGYTRYKALVRKHSLLFEAERSVVNRFCIFAPSD
jgi:hypothetical protein